MKKCVEFMDEQRVGPCGFCQGKGILVGVFASFSSIETTLDHSIESDKNTVSLVFTTSLRCKPIHEGQHPSALNITARTRSMSLYNGSWVYLAKMECTKENLVDYK